MPGPVRMARVAVIEPVAGVPVVAAGEHLHQQASAAQHDGDQIEQPHGRGGEYTPCAHRAIGRRDLT